MLAWLAPIPLYAAVIAGLYLFESGWAAIVGYHVAICAVIAVGGDGRKLQGVLFRGWNRAFGIGMTAACLISGLLVYLLWPIIRLEHVELGTALADLGLQGWSWLLFMAYYSLVNPAMEEIFWRRWYPSKLKIPLFSDVFFAGYHVFVMVLFVQAAWAGVTFVVLVAAARIWRELTHRYRGLAIPLASHTAADVSVIAAAAWLALG